MSLLLHVIAWVTGNSIESLLTSLIFPATRAFYVRCLIHFNPMRPIIFQVHFHGNYYAGDHIDIHDNPYCSFYQGQPFTTTTPRASETSVEDVTPVSAHVPCPFLVPDKLTELGLYSLEQFETMFREAAESDAKTLAAFLKKYRQMGVLDFKGKDKKQIFAELRACFPTMKQYSYRNFIEYF